MKIVIPVCIMCESEEVALWTLDGKGTAAVTYLCDEHSAPLEAIIAASEGLPLDMQVPLTRRRTIGKQRDRARALQERDHRRKRTMEPLVGWTPPEESDQQVAGADAVLPDVDVAV